MNASRIAYLESPAYLNANRGPALFDTTIAFTTLETVFISLYLVSRILERSAKSWDVYLMGLGYVFDLSLSAVVFVMIEHARLGRNIGYGMIDTAVRYNVLRKCLQFLYPVAIALPKLAILFLYHRLFCRMLCRRTTQVTGVIIILTWLTSFLLAAFICHPFDYEWNFAVEDVPGSGCGDVDLAQVVISFPNILTDILILIIPIRSLWRLQVPTAKKVGLLLTFGSGCLGTITGIIRVVAFFIYEKEADESDAYSTFLSNGLITWTIVEPSVYLIAATLPFMRPLLRRISDKGHLSDRLTTSTRYYRSWRPRGSNTGSDGNLHLKPKNAAACPVAPLPIDLEKSLPSVPSATASSDSERASMACTHSSHTFTPSGKGDDTKSYSCPLCT